MAEQKADDRIHETLQVLQGILAAIQGVVGEGAAQALLRYGAAEEGKRLALENRLRDLDHVMAIARRIALLEGRAEPAGSGVRIQVARCPLLERQAPVLETLLIGLLEGMLSSLLQTRLRGRIAHRDAAGGTTLSFETE